MTYATLIHCPKGGTANDEDLERAREQLSRAYELEVRIVGENDTTSDHAEQAVAAGSKLLIASGGDGTVSAVAGALIGRDVTLGILPRGTANSIAGRLGIPDNIDEACEIIAAGHARTIDTASVNGRASLLMATVGVHAEAITEVDPERKKRYGALAYVMEEVERMLANELFEVTIEANGQRLTAEANAVTVANIAPPWTLLAQGNAKVEEDDGMLDVTLVAIRGFADAVGTSLHLATSAIRELPAERDNIGSFRTAEIRIDTKPPKRVMVDGEDAESTPLHIRCLPKSLRVLVPKAEA